MSAVHGVVLLRYLAYAPIVVRGPISGATYAFSMVQRDQPVDARDADSLIRTNYFQRVG